MTRLMNAGRCPALLLAVTAFTTGCGDGSREFLSLGTAGTGGVYYPLGGAIASRLDAADEQRRYTAEVTGGSVENIQRIRNGQMDLAFTIATTAYEAYHGGTDFPERFDRLRLVAPLYPNLTHVLVPAGSRVSSIADLRGRRISVGAAGSGTEQVARHLLEAFSLTYEDIDQRFLSFTESAAALGDGAIDAAILSVGYPASAVLEAMTTYGARLLPIEPERVRTLRQRYPYYTPGSIPAGAYPRQGASVPSVAVMNWVVARDDLDRDVVESLLELLSTQRDELRRVVDIAAQIDLGRLDDAPIPLHDAARAWRDAHLTGARPRDEQ